MPVNVWRSETFDERAPGELSHTNTRFTSMKVFCRTATPQSIPLETTHSIRLLLGRCNNPNNRWWTGSNRPRFTSFAFVAALTKVHPPFFVPTKRFLHPIYTGVRDPNFVYPLPSLLCLPSPAAGSGRHRISAHPGKKKKPPCPNTSLLCVHWSKHDQTVCINTMVLSTFVP